MLTILLCTIVATLMAGHHIIYLQESNRINESQSAILRDAHVAVGGSAAALKTFAALHPYGTSSKETFVENHSQYLLTDNLAINSVGRFENAGDLSLPITDALADIGELDTLNGLDLGNFDQVRERLPQAIEADEVVVIQAPDQWPVTADLVLLQPSYHISPIPAEDATRESTFIGGYWAGINFQDILNVFYSAPDMATVDSVVSITHSHFDAESHGAESIDTHSGSDEHSAENNHVVYVATFKSNRSNWFPSFFQPIVRDRVLSLGNDQIVISVVSNPTLSLMSVVLGALVTGFLISLYLICLTVVYNRRRGNHQKLQALQAVTRERAKAERTLNSISESVIALDELLNITYVNQAAISALGVDPDEVIGAPVLQVTKFYEIENTGATFDLATALSALEIGDSAELDIIIYDKNHVMQSMQLSMTNSAENELHASRFTLVLRDVSAERALTRELEYQANHDSLTGVWNRYYFEKRLNDMVESAQRKQITHALVYMDLDQFKIVNDTCGHTAGDRLLKELTQNLSAVLRPGDVLARLGGDEFGLLVINAAHEDAVQVAERVFSFFQNSVFYHEGKAFPVRASIGFVPINEKSCSIGDVLSAADIACYAAKDGGRNSLNIYSEDNAHIAQRHQEMNWLPRLQAALKDNHFQLLVQAVADTQTKDIEHYEFLLRLRRPDGSVVTPMQFIQAAERYDLMKDIDRWVIKAAIQDIAEHHEALGGKASYSINLSGQSAADASLLPFIEECINEAQIPAHIIWFEITETAAITHFQVAVELFQKLRAMGAKVALDDFGSGLSSFGYLKNLPVDVIKIDGQFVKNLEHDHIDREMVSAIHRVAQTMGICSVAEFVESEKSLEQLAAIGVDLAQGYHIARPCSLEDAVRQHQRRTSGKDDGADLSSAA